MNYLLNGKVTIIHLIVGLIKIILIHKMSYLPEPYKCSKNKIKFELDLLNYATKSDLKSATGIDTWKSAKMTDLASLKSVYDKLVKKIKAIDTSRVV